PIHTPRRPATTGTEADWSRSCIIPWGGGRDGKHGRVCFHRTRWGDLGGRCLDCVELLLQLRHTLVQAPDLQFRAQVAKASSPQEHAEETTKHAGADHPPRKRLGSQGGITERKRYGIGIEERKNHTGQKD